MTTQRPEIYKEEGYRLMGAAFEVYNEQGYGLAEEIYQESLESELELRGIKAQSKSKLRVFYGTHQSQGLRSLNAIIHALPRVAPAAQPRAGGLERLWRSPNYEFTQ